MCSCVCFGTLHCVFEVLEGVGECVGGCECASECVTVLYSIAEVLRRVYVLEAVCGDCEGLGMIECLLIVVQW